MHVSFSNVCTVRFHCFALMNFPPPSVPLLFSCLFPFLFECIKNVEGTGSNLENNRTFVPVNEQHTQQKQLKSGKVYLVHSLKCLVHRCSECLSEQMHSHSKTAGGRVLLGPQAGKTSKGLALLTYAARQSSSSKGPIASPNSCQLKNKCANNESVGNITDSNCPRQ